MVSFSNVFLEFGNHFLIFSLLGTCWIGSSVGFKKLKQSGSSSIREASQGPSRQGMSKFGCTFQNQDYYVHTDSVFNPVYGAQVSPMDFRDVTAFDRVFAVIKEEYANLLKEFVYTNFPVFSDFYDSYRMYDRLYGMDSWNKMIHFYRGYTPKFFPHTVCSSMATEILDRISRRIPGISRSVHLITCSMDTPKSLFRALNIPNTFPMPAFSRKRERSGASSSGSIQFPPKLLFTHGHVAALVRIRIAGRLGYVLLDPGLAYAAPVVIMEGDLTTPTILEYGRDSSGRTGIQFLLPRQDYILAKPTASRPTDQPDNDYLYFIGRPYCSFHLTNSKTSVVKTNRKIVRRDSTGLPIASITFDAVRSPHVFNMALRTHNTSTQRQMIPFFSRNQLSQKAQQHYNRVKTVMNYPQLEEFLTKAEAIAKDKIFYNLVKNLHQHHMAIILQEKSHIPY